MNNIYFQACDNVINGLGIKTAIFTSLRELFDFLRPNKLKTIGDKEYLDTANFLSKNVSRPILKTT